MPTFLSGVIMVLSFVLNTAHAAPALSPACAFGVRTANGPVVLMQNEIFFRVRESDSPEGYRSHIWYQEFALAFDVHVPHTKCPPMEVLEVPVFVEVFDPNNTGWIHEMAVLPYAMELYNLHELVTYSLTHLPDAVRTRGNTQMAARFVGSSQVPAMPYDEPTTNWHQVYLPPAGAQPGDCMRAWIPSNSIVVSDGVQAVRVAHPRIQHNGPWLGWFCFE